MKIEETVHKTIKDYLGIDELTNESKIDDDLGADSLDQVEIVMNLEEIFEITTTDEEIEACITVQDVVNLVTSKYEQRKST